MEHTKYGLLKERLIDKLLIDKLYIQTYKILQKNPPKNPTRISSRYKSSCVFRTLQKIKMEIFLKIITILTRQLCSEKSPSWMFDGVLNLSLIQLLLYNPLPRYLAFLISDCDKDVERQYVLEMRVYIIYITLILDKKRI